MTATELRNRRLTMLRAATDNLNSLVERYLLEGVENFTHQNSYRFALNEYEVQVDLCKQAISMIKAGGESSDYIMD